MLQLEIFEILNQIKKTEEEYEKTKLETSLKKLISENKTEFLNFAQKNANEIDEKTKNYLQTLYNKTEEQERKIKETETKTDDISYIKIKYSTFKKELINNNYIPNQNCENIIEEIINKYIESNYETLKKILEIKDDDIYEKFKNMINNYIRKYYSIKIQHYMQTPNYTELNFFSKRKKKNQILKILNHLSNYKFNKEEIIEALQ